MNPNNPHLPWKGITAEIGRLAAAGKLDLWRFGSPDSAKRYCAELFPGYPEMSRSCAAKLSDMFREPQKTSAPATVKRSYAGILFDNDDIILQIGGHSWTFTPDEWAAAKKMMNRVSLE